MLRAFRYKAKLAPSAVRNAESQLALLCELYNAALEERTDAWKRAKVRIGFYQQSKQLPEIKKIRPEYTTISAQAIEQCLKRLEWAFAGFFRRVKAGQAPGYPRFKSRTRYDSITFRQTGWRLDGRYLTLQGIGTLRLFLSRPIEGTIKTITLRRDACGAWFVTFACQDISVKPLPISGRVVGLDMGISSFIATSDGELISNPRHFVAYQAKLRRAQRVLDRRRRGGQNRRNAARLVAKIHRRVRDSRRDFHFKIARSLVERYDLIAVEDLHVASLVQGKLAKHISDAGWDGFLHALATKAEEAERRIVAVDPRGTSQSCSGCGVEVRKALSVRVHHCPHCGLTLDRDINAARNVLTRAGAPPAGSSSACREAA